jgi:hypothetical protein
MGFSGSARKILLWGYCEEEAALGSQGAAMWKQSTRASLGPWAVTISDLKVMD